MEGINKILIFIRIIGIIVIKAIYKYWIRLKKNEDYL